MDPSFSSNETFIHALIQNNSGVLALEKGDYSAARDSFRRALDTLTTTISHKLSSTTDKKSGCSATFQWSHNAPVYFHSNSASTQMTFVYKRALIMMPCDDDDDEQQQTPADTSGCCEADFAEESSAIVYNLALSYHLMGLSANRSDILERALKFYEICNNIRQNNEMKKLDIIDLALLNNVGQAQHEFCNYSTARECFDMLTRRLQVLNSHGMICLLERCDCDGFVLNAMLEEPTMAAAA